ncbi:MAG TPA: DUF1080 domain-containing protein [Lacunisphaera sp.]|nr:DUF1080 domain-containing protein [Lacunisphaera sp.]
MTTAANILLRMLGVLLSAGSLAAAEPAWRPLFNGRDLAGWDTFLATPDASWDVPGMTRNAQGRYAGPIGVNHDPLKVFNVEEVGGRPAIHITGQGFGTMTTRESFENVRVRVQVRWGERKWGYKLHAPRDCGLLYFVHGEPGFDHGTWPRSIEFQIQEHDMGDLYAIATQITVNARPETSPGGRKLYHYDPAGTPTLFISRPPIGNRCVKAGDPEKPHGEWNTLELICWNGDSVHIVNGQVVMRLHHAERLDGSAPAPLTGGQISLQTEGAEVYYRDIEVQALAAKPPEFAEP